MEVESTEDNYFDFLPDEIVQKIFSHGNYLSIKPLSDSCKRFREIVSDKNFDGMKALEESRKQRELMTINPVINNMVTKGFFSVPHFRSYLQSIDPILATNFVFGAKRIDSIFKNVNLNSVTSIDVKSDKSPFSGDRSLHTLLFYAAQMPNLRQLNLEGITLDQKSIELISQITKLKELHISKSLNSTENMNLLKTSTKNIKGLKISVHRSLPTDTIEASNQVKKESFFEKQDREERIKRDKERHQYSSCDPIYY